MRTTFGFFGTSKNGMKISKSMFHLTFWPEISVRHWYGHKMRISDFNFLILAVMSQLWAKNDHFIELPLKIGGEKLANKLLWKLIPDRHMNDKICEEPGFFNGKSLLWARFDHWFFLYTFTLLMSWFFPQIM